MFKTEQRFSANDIKTIINAGFEAKCAKVEYNGLIITYNTPPSNVVVPIVDTPIHNDTKDAIVAEAKVISDMEDLMYTNPLQYEENLALEDNNR